MSKKIVFFFIFIVIIIGSLSFIFLIPTLFFNFEQLNRVKFNVNSFPIDDFAYWLNDLNKEDIRNSKYDLIIMDYSSDGYETGEYSSADVSYMKSGGDKKKLLISYVSIGEAEDYRFYWEESWDADHDGIPDLGAPIWLDIENPEWEGNYKVKFWMNEWQQIVFNYIDKILVEGFDGIYMDIVDAYEYYQCIIPHSDWEMINFVGKISNYVKTHTNTNFSIFVQNADELLLNYTYLECIDGIGREDLFYLDNNPTDDNWRNEGINNLNQAINNNKTVFITDYPQIKELKYEFYRNCIINRFLGYAAHRNLDKLEEYEFYPST